MEIQDYGNTLQTLHPVLTPEECAAFIARAEFQGFELASITTPHGAVIREDVRNNDRVIIDDPALAAELWQRVKDHLPAMRGNSRAIGLNERFRFYRYLPGQRFSWHADGVYKRPNGERSLMTFMVYLNEGFTGGKTRFEWTAIAGRTGMGIVFDHDLMHEGGQLDFGVKYVLRSDVMFEARR